MLEQAVGAGASADVWRARHQRTGAEGAFKWGREGAWTFRESQLLAWLDRRWGPALLDCGDWKGRFFIVTEWIEGVPLPREGAADTRFVLQIAHAVGRSLEELHAAGVRHGDVKPANILVHPRASKRDVPDERAATLIDLSLASRVGDPERGGSLRYLAPEIRHGHAVGPEADLFALGIVLAELVSSAVLRADEPLSKIHTLAAKTPVARWAQALVAQAPGGRPSAGWIADNAARLLELGVVDAEIAERRKATVRRVYIDIRTPELAKGLTPSGAIGGEPHVWLSEAAKWIAKGGVKPRGPMAEMDAFCKRRWLVGVVGAHANAWPVPPDDEGALAARMLDLAAVRDPRAFRAEDFARGGAELPSVAEPVASDSKAARADMVVLAAAVCRPRPPESALARIEIMAEAGEAPEALVELATRSLLRRGECGRAWALLSYAGQEADSLRAEVSRRRGEPEIARRFGAKAPAVLGRLAWDAGDLDGATRHARQAVGAAQAELLGLIAYTRGEYELGIGTLDTALAGEDDVATRARLFGVLGMLEHARGRSRASLEHFGRAVELAIESGALVEEASYLTGEAAAATDAGAVDRALAASTRAALLWERLGQHDKAARALLARASVLASIGALHAAREAAEDTMTRARASGDHEVASLARWVIAETTPWGDKEAREQVLAARSELAHATLSLRVRADACVLLCVPSEVSAQTIAEHDEHASMLDAVAQWEWWGARAAAAASHAAGIDVLHRLVGLLDAAAPIPSRGIAIHHAVALASRLGEGELVRRFESMRQSLAETIHRHTPPEWKSSLANVAWARLGAAASAFDVSSEQLAQFEILVASLAERGSLRALLAQVLDAMILWCGVERGLFLLRAPDGRLVVKVARNLAREDLVGAQLALSQSIAERAVMGGDCVVVTDAMAGAGDTQASVHALGLRSVLAVPLRVQGQTLGVVYLDDRARRGAFGQKELAWIRLLAAQAAMAIADARAQVLLRRAARRARRAEEKTRSLLSQREVELDQARAEIRRAEGVSTRYAYDAIVGRSDAMLATLHLVDKVTPTNVPVLFVGESGTGKELLARALHDNGPRQGRAFVTENCAALPEPLLESALFGHVKGAFTGATRTHAGLLHMAHGGTLFLDEIGEMSLGMQAKLLRVLAEGEVRPVGGERPSKVDVRVLGATHRDLAQMVARGTFREDLYYRLHVVMIRVPSLRERRDDIPLLVSHFLQKYGPGAKVTRRALDKLRQFDWPGNVRQLENEVRRALVLAEGRIDVEHLSELVVSKPTHEPAGLDLRSRIDAFEASLVRAALEETRGNQTRAAVKLGVSRFGLQKMIKRLKIDVTME